MCEQLCEGPCISLEISSANENTVEAFRQLCGPSDPVCFDFQFVIFKFKLELFLLIIIFLNIEILIPITKL